MNRILPFRPSVNASTYIHATPGWLLALCRVAFGLGGLVLAVLSWRSWHQMPSPARGLAAVLSPVFVGLSAWSRPWLRTAKFVADEQGIHFPANELLVLSFNRSPVERWLLVPWQNVRNVRLAREEGDGNRCVAFDVQVTAEETVSFFRHVARPGDRSGPQRGMLAVAYDDSPPSPGRTLQILLALKARAEA